MTIILIMINQSQIIHMENSTIHCILSVLVYFFKSGQLYYKSLKSDAAQITCIFLHEVLLLLEVQELQVIHSSPFYPGHPAPTHKTSSVCFKPSKTTFSLHFCIHSQL